MGGASCSEKLCFRTSTKKKFFFLSQRDSRAETHTKNNNDDVDDSFCFTVDVDSASSFQRKPSPDFDPRSSATWRECRRARLCRQCEEKRDAPRGARSGRCNCDDGDKGIIRRRHRHVIVADGDLDLLLLLLNLNLSSDDPAARRRRRLQLLVPRGPRSPGPIRTLRDASCYRRVVVGRQGSDFLF